MEVEMVLVYSKFIDIIIDSPTTRRMDYQYGTISGWQCSSCSFRYFLLHTVPVDHSSSISYSCISNWHFKLNHILSIKISIFGI